MSRCPFLREAQVRFCSASAYKKLIVRSEESAAERCTSAQWISCPVAKQHREDHPNRSRCPFLHESLVQYCSVAGPSKYVPYTDASSSRCNTDNHRYCDAYFAVANPSGGPAQPDSETVDGVKVPSGLAYTRNHFWYDESADGWWHAGIDDFLARTLGDIEQVTFVTVGGTEQPTVLLRIPGVELTGMFPGRLAISGINRRLRQSPRAIVSHPYTQGWLFEGKCGRQAMPAAMVRGPEALEWMHEEIHRLNDCLQELGSQQDHRLAADGGTPIEGVFRHLTREQVLLVFNKFFHPLQFRSSAL